MKVVQRLNINGNAVMVIGMGRVMCSVNAIELGDKTGRGHAGIKTQEELVGGIRAAPLVPATRFQPFGLKGGSGYKGPEIEISIVCNVLYYAGNDGMNGIIKDDWFAQDIAEGETGVIFTGIAFGEYCLIGLV